MVTHTADDRYPFCPLCTEVRKWGIILDDICEGRLEVPVDENGNVILLEEWEVAS
jgi:hypothetical protein